MRLAFAAALCFSLVAPTFAHAENFRSACKIKVLCPDFEPGGGRAIACLRAHKAQLSVPCKLAIADFFLNKQPKGGGEGGGGGEARGPNARPRGAGPDGGGRAPDEGPDGPGGPDQGGPAGPDGPDQGPPPPK